MIKSRLAEKYAVEKIKDFSEDMWVQYGVRLFTLLGYEAPNSQICYSSCDFNPILGGVDYRKVESHDWPANGITLDSWKEHLEESYKEIPLIAGRTVQHVSQPTVVLETNEYNEPVLPDPTIFPFDNPKSQFQWLRNLVRAFLTGHYGM